MLFPTTPPTAAPMARGVLIFIFSAPLPFPLPRINDTTDMDNTVHPDKKLMALTEIRPKASNTGLMITPPPIPLIAPMVEAMKLIKKKMAIVNLCPLYLPKNVNVFEFPFSKPDRKK